VSRKGKAGPLEAGRGKYSPPANPERVTSEGLKRRDKGVHHLNIKYEINSIVCKNIVKKSQEIPIKGGIPWKTGKTNLSERGFEQQPLSRRV
jgi:hypothetical protein